MGDITTVKHISPKHVVISPASGWSVTVFNIAEGKFIDAIVSDGEETIKLSLEGPDEATGIVISHDSLTGDTNVMYVTRGRDGSIV